MGELRWRPGFAVDVYSVLAPLRRGSADPAWQRDKSGTVWLARNTPAGGALMSIAPAGAEVLVRAVGDGADWCLETAPVLLGAADDDSGFHAHHRLIADARHRQPGLRIGATGVVWDVLLAAILEQKVTGYEARRSWRELCRRFGKEIKHGGTPTMFVPPEPMAVRAIADWEWHRAGVDGARRKTILRAAAVARRLEGAAHAPETGMSLLRKVSGIGGWTAAEVAQRAWGDPDAVSFGDLHIPAVVGQALTGKDVDDDGLAELLEPYSPQRQRAVRYIEASGFTRPRIGPRYAGRDYRAI